jgi:predicted aspartyl protease
MKSIVRPISLSFTLGLGLAFPHAPQAEPIIVPLIDDGACFRVPVTLSGQTNFFIVDTGTSATGLDVKFREGLGKPTRHEGQQTFYNSPKIGLGNTPFGLKEIFCTDLTLFRQITGERCEGIIGMDFLEDRLVELDFDNALFTIHSTVPEQFTKNASRIAMHVYNQRHHMIPARINDQSSNLMVDTGQSRTISLNRADWDQVFQPGEKMAVHKVLIAQLGGKVAETYIARLSRLQIGANEYADLLCRLNTSALPSSFGMGFLRCHRVLLDFPRNALYLMPRKNIPFKEEHDMSGLHLLRRDEITFVHSIDQGSPASLGGVQAGDIVLSLNSRKCSEMKMKEIRQLLRANPGDKSAVEVQRNGEVVRIAFVLKRFL